MKTTRFLYKEALKRIEALEKRIEALEKQSKPVKRNAAKKEVK